MLRTISVIELQKCLKMKIKDLSRNNVEKNTRLNFTFKNTALEGMKVSV